MTEPVLQKLIEVLPGDAFCILAVTMEDIYLDDDYNFVFGSAYLSERSGVFSFARYSPPDAETLSDPQRRKLTQRAFKVLAHEVGHMFGISHCTAYECGMNGSNSLAETDRHPIHFCPVCLQKLHSSIGFDIAQRDRALIDRLDDAGLASESAILQQRLAWTIAD